MTASPATCVLEGRVLPAWVDYNDHMNVAFYVLAFDQATDALLARCGVDDAYRSERQHSLFVLEMHVNYLAELARDAPFAIHSRILAADAKRVHIFHEMFHADSGVLAATNEVMTMHVDMRSKRSAAFPDEVAARIEQQRLHDADLPRPPQAGNRIGLPSKTRS